MQRLTSRGKDGKARVPAGTVMAGGQVALGPAIERLARFEDFCQALEAEQAELAQKLEQLRGEGKRNSVRFKEALGKKLTGSTVLALLKTYGLE